MTIYWLHFPILSSFYTFVYKRERERMSTIEYKQYESELQLPAIIHLIENDLSEPYSIYTYRYFIHNWPNLCFLVKKKKQRKSTWADYIKVGHGWR